MILGYADVYFYDVVKLVFFKLQKENQLRYQKPHMLSEMFAKLKSCGMENVKILINQKNGVNKKIKKIMKKSSGRFSSPKTLISNWVEFSFFHFIKYSQWFPDKPEGSNTNKRRQRLVYCYHVPEKQTEIIVFLSIVWFYMIHYRLTTLFFSKISNGCCLPRVN